MKDKRRLRSEPRIGVSFVTVVIHAKLCDSGHELNQLDPASIVSLTDLVFRNVMPTLGNSRSDAGDVKLRSAQTDEPKADLESR